MTMEVVTEHGGRATARRVAWQSDRQRGWQPILAFEVPPNPAYGFLSSYGSESQSMLQAQNQTFPPFHRSATDRRWSAPRVLRGLHVGQLWSTIMPMVLQFARRWLLGLRAQTAIFKFSAQRVTKKP